MPYGTWLRIGQSPLRLLRQPRFPAAGFWHVSGERFFASARSGTRAFKKVPKLRRAQSLIGVGLGGSVFLAVAFSKAAAKAGREDEAIWASRRGPLAWDAQRAIEFAPLIPCIGSGLVAVTITRMYPCQVALFRVPANVHELVALPLSILLAFRFQLSYDRWWQSRQHVQDVSINAVAIAMSAANNQDSMQLSLTGKLKGEIEENERRLLGLLDAACASVEFKLSCGKPPHPANDSHVWEPMDAHLNPEDAAAIARAAHPVLWCFDSIFSTIHRGQMLGAYSAELASGMYERATAMLTAFRFCQMVLQQQSPAPFMVHLRTLLLVFCVSFPFTIIGYVGPWGLMLMQIALSFSLLGIEFVSRQMEHPFGEDESDIPLKQVMAGTRGSIQLILLKHDHGSQDIL
ncbi:unnamed protein product [Symbiodinium sp. KB8]|nr:unnamed protein product [Symbiodinium sp. KB8]